MAVLVAGVTAAGLAGCGGPDITVGRVDDSVGVAFAHLYQRQQQLLGKPMGAVTYAAAATCGRANTATKSQGAGSDWVCTVLLTKAGLAAQQYTYDLDVKADGCYVADGPPGLVGGQTLTTAAGKAVVNPLFAFNACFATY